MAEGQEQRGTAGGPRRRPVRGERVWEPRPPLPSAVRRRSGLLRWLSAGLSAAVLLSAGAGALLYLRLNGNIRDMPLFGGIGGDAGHERPDAFGRTPVNVLVIGSDSRADPADCKLGGDCGPGRNADVAMVLHVSADRGHATVLSIPRDTVTDLPACRTPKGGTAAARRGPVNSTLQYGPGCTVAAVHSLTRIPIDHFVMVDFAGVVRMSDAVGGVPVCVDRDLYDPYSHLKLARGRHDLRGRAALEYLRTRHAFGDGSDLGRTAAQHLFLSALGRRLRQSGSLTDPAGMLSLADAATKALTVDPGLAAVPRLVGLAEDVRKVPSPRVSFTTMPVAADPDNAARLVPAPGARRVFAAIAADTPPRATPARGASRVDESFDGPAASAAARGATRQPSGPACAKVATAATVTVRGRAMNPTAAYAATPRIRVSAR
ncbi:transcriptional attenuator, LytR family [Actinacidiphila yanglinensis]|uniref:Transcriptional attenuator, LytR family n=1 Tax=Actinacidiphila yanglinensis TaxID=310779 RepID=A0A1H6DZT6_9ACTN|nr:LCP family protein [Actinacidiphila yanglinensis]SEG90185.1 transcriptional attenuator, LytR family [Actinacidiphila yanglinensis]